MFPVNSRYHRTTTATYLTEDGRSIAYLRRRFVPRGDKMQVLAEVEVSGGDRLDLITSRTLGDPEQYWRVCDANNAMNPVTLISEVGRRLIIPIPQFEGFAP